MSYVISKPGVQKPYVYWFETQSSPVRGKWVASINKATTFSKVNCHYIRKYMSDETEASWESV